MMVCQMLLYLLATLFSPNYSNTICTITHQYIGLRVCSIQSYTRTSIQQNPTIPHLYQSWHHSCVAGFLSRGSDTESSTWGCSLWLKQLWGGYTFNRDTNQIFSLMLILKADDLIALLGKRSICVYGWDVWVGEKENERLKSHLKMSFKSFASCI